MLPGNNSFNSTNWSACALLTSIAGMGRRTDEVTLRLYKMIPEEVLNGFLLEMYERERDRAQFSKSEKTWKRKQTRGYSSCLQGLVYT